MVNKTTFHFLQEIQANNTKEWFGNHQEEYLKIKENLIEIAARMIKDISAFDKDIKSADLEPKKCLSRINRDMRFAKNKPPYKSDFYVIANMYKRQEDAAGYYIHIQPDGCAIGAGIPTPQPDSLKTIRQEILYSSEKWLEVVEDNDFTRLYKNRLWDVGTLQRNPKGFEEETDVDQYIRMKGFCTRETISLTEAGTEKGWQKITDYLKGSLPLVTYLNKALENK